MGRHATLIGAIAQPPESILEGHYSIGDYVPAARGTVRDKEFFAGDENDLVLAANQREAHQQTMEDYPKLINLYLKWLFPSEFIEERFVSNRWTPHSLFFLPPLSRFLRAPLHEEKHKDKDPIWVRREDNNMPKYAEAFEAIKWEVEQVGQCFANPVTLDKDPIKAQKQLHDLLKTWGTKISEHWSYKWWYPYQDSSPAVFPNPPKPGDTKEGRERAEDQIEFLKRTTTFYLLYVLSLIPWDDLKRMDLPFIYEDQRKYYELLELTDKDFEGLAEKNTSFNSVYNGIVRDLIKNLVNDPDFTRKIATWPGPLDSRARYWLVWYTLRGSSTSYPKPSDLEATPTFPYPDAAKSETDPRK